MARHKSNVATGRWRPLIITAIFTGMRSSELRGLRWGDVNFTRKVIAVSQHAEERGGGKSPCRQWRSRPSRNGS